MSARGLSGVNIKMSYAPAPAIPRCSGNKQCPHFCSLNQPLQSILSKTKSASPSDCDTNKGRSARPENGVQRSLPA